MPCPNGMSGELVEQVLKSPGGVCGSIKLISENTPCQKNKSTQGKIMK